MRFLYPEKKTHDNGGMNVFRVCFFVFYFSHFASAQVGTQTRYSSELDQALSFEKIAVAPVLDNVNGVYSGPLTEVLTEWLNTEKQYAIVPLSKKQDTDYFEPEQVLKILSDAKTDALISSRVLRGPQGITLRMTLATRPMGTTLIQETRNMDKTESLEDIKREFGALYKFVLSRLPFDGKILSRRGQEVTLDIGSLRGVRAGQELEVVQILKIDRHPKHQFMVGSEKTVMGKLQITKAEPSLSFGRITFEKERGVVVVGAKIISDRKVAYASSNSLPQDPSFGENPNEWVNRGPPQFGRIAFLAGIGQYNQSANLNTAGDVDATSNVSPTLKLEGELWLNPEWFFSLNLMQSAFTLSNPVSGDSPSNLDTSLNSYTLAGGYNWLLEDDFYGPKLQVSAGLHQWTSDPDRSSPTVAFTRMQFGGMFLGFDGTFVLDPASPWSLGAHFKYFISTTVTDSPKSGSPGGENITNFGFYVRKKQNQRMSYVGRLDFENYSSSFSGTATRPDPATKISHKNQLFLIGIEYGF